MTTSSRAELPGWTTYFTPDWAARSMESRNGKNASEASATPSIFAIQSARSWAVSGSGAGSNASCHWRCSNGVGSRSRYWSMALFISARFRSARKVASRTFGCWRSHHVSAFEPASRVQWTRDCWPAPMPMAWPLAANATEFDCVYFRAIDPTTRSRTASSGMSFFFVTTPAQISGPGTAALRVCSSHTP